MPNYSHTCLPLLLVLLAVLTSGCTSLPTDVQRTPSYVVKDTGNTRIGSKVKPVLEKYPHQSGFYVLNDGIDAFVARMKMADAAEKTLDVQYYIWHLDMTGRLLFDKLIATADRGVRVRLLLDDLDTAEKDLGLNLLDLHPNIEVRVYNPFTSRGSRAIGFLTDLSRVNHRMHNKSMTADNQITIVGGRNIGNEYFGAVSASAFADLDVLAIGTVVNEVSTAFDTYWNSEWVYPITAFESEDPVTQQVFDSAQNRLSEYVKQAENSPYAKAVTESTLFTKAVLSESDFFWGKALLLYDAPSKAEGSEISEATHIGPKLGKVFNSAKKELLIISPYFVPGEKLVEFLGELEKRGTQVKILTNSLAANDVGVVHAGYMRYRIPLLKRGIELYEYKPDLETLNIKTKTEKRWSGSSKASLHAKTFGIDRQYMFVGSFNLDPRSVSLNTEMGVLFESPELAGMLGEGFDKKIANKAYRLELVTIPEDESESGFEEVDIRWISVENGKEVIYETEPHIGFWRRFSVGLMSIFVIESFL